MIRSRSEQKLAALKRRQPLEHVADYHLAGPRGPVKLSALFGRKRDLIVIHNMGRSCPYCTMWADGINGLYPHLADRAGFVVVSPDSPAVQKKFAASRGWRFPMASGQGSTFIHDMGYQHEARRAVARECRRSCGSAGNFFAWRRRRSLAVRCVLCDVADVRAARRAGLTDWQPKYRVLRHNETDRDVPRRVASSLRCSPRRAANRRLRPRRFPSCNSARKPRRPRERGPVCVRRARRGPGGSELLARATELCPDSSADYWVELGRCRARRARQPRRRQGSLPISKCSTRRATSTNATRRKRMRCCNRFMPLRSSAGWMTLAHGLPATRRTTRDDYVLGVLCRRRPVLTASSTSPIFTKSRCEGTPLPANDAK